MHVPEGVKDVTCRAGSIMTGVLMNSTERIRTDSILFYDTTYKKYFCVFVIEPELRDMGRQSSFVGDDISYRKTIKALINKYELNSPRSWFLKPTQSLCLDFVVIKIAHFQNDKNSKYYEYAFSRPAYYKRAVELYLTYMMSKEEFKERFEKE